VLDTNVLVSGIAYPHGLPGAIVSMWRNGSLEVTLSPYLLDEFRRVLPRLSRNTLSAAEIDRLVDTFLFSADIVVPSEVVASVRDSKDDPVLALLAESGAEALVTGDKDLLALADRYPILTPAEFWRRYGGATGRP
jgi:putative PIN family toxin of toxin-antitoxin system